MSITIYGVIIDHADGLHKRVTNGGADKFKSPFAHIFAHGQGFRTCGWYLVQLFPVVLDGVMIYKLPEIAVEAAKIRLNLQKSNRIGDKGPDLEVVADNTLILKQCLNPGFIIADHQIRFKSVECQTLGFPFF